MKPNVSIFDIPKEKRPMIEKRFWSKVEKTKGCWNWKGQIQPNGYAKFPLTHEKNMLGHRLVYEFVNGQIPEGETVDHLCRNRGCVNPEHLQAVTNRENVLRGIGLTALNAKKTHCPHGHLLAGNNLVPYALKRGYRMCRTCFNEANKQYQRIQRSIRVESH